MRPICVSTANIHFDNPKLRVWTIYWCIYSWLLQIRVLIFLSSGQSNMIINRRKKLRIELTALANNFCESDLHTKKGPLWDPLRYWLIITSSKFILFVYLWVYFVIVSLNWANWESQTSKTITLISFFLRQSFVRKTYNSNRNPCGNQYLIKTLRWWWTVICIKWI